MVIQNQYQEKSLSKNVAIMLCQIKVKHDFKSGKYFLLSGKPGSDRKGTSNRI
jgi:hypothetical protein